MGMCFSPSHVLLTVTSDSLQVPHPNSALPVPPQPIKDLSFEPQGNTSLNEPKFGKEDEKNEEHHGGNTWAGGVS